MNKFYIIFLSFLIFTTSCQQLGEGLTGSKRSKTSDEFLVQKKSPLIMPPDFNDMPLPQAKKKKEKSATIQDLLNINNQNEIENNESSSSLENSILKKIKTH